VIVERFAAFDLLVVGTKAGSNVEDEGSGAAADTRLAVKKAGVEL